MFCIFIALSDKLYAILEKHFIVKENKTTLILFTIFFVVCGFLLIYRGQMNVDNFLQFNATVKEKYIAKQDKLNSVQYCSLDLSFVENNDVYGIYLGTKDQAEKENLINKIVVGDNYKFYVDPTVGKTINNENLGIRIIESNGQIIYKENASSNFIFGGLFIVFGILTSALLIYRNRKKNVI